MTFLVPISDLIDTVALALVHGDGEATPHTGGRVPLGQPTATSKRALGELHGQPPMKALVPLLDATQARDPRLLTGRQIHVLVALAAADLLGPAHLATFLDSYVEPGIDIRYEPVSVTGLRRVLTEVLSPYAQATRARLLTELAAYTQDELLRWAPTEMPFAHEFLDHYARSASTNLRRQVARNTTVASTTLSLLAHDADRFVRIAVARNPNTDADTLAGLALDREPEVRKGVAHSATTRPSTLAELAHAPAATVRAGVAANPNTAAATLDVLARDTNRSVRAAAGANPSTDTRTLEALVKDSDLLVAIALARNPGLPEVLMAVSAGHHRREVRATIAANPGANAALLARLADDGDAQVRQVIAQRSDVDPIVLTTLAQDREWNVRLSVAKNPTTDPSALERLAGHADWDIRVAIANNAATESALLAALAEDREWDVREAVASSPRCPSGLLARLAHDEEPYVRLAVARNPNIDTETLAHLARDREREVRRQVGLHSRTERDIHRQLATDGDASATRTLTGATREIDPQLRYRMALDETLDAKRIIPAPFVEYLSMVATAVRAGATPGTHNALGLAALPNFDDLTFPTAVLAQARFDEAMAPVRVLHNGREQRRNGIAMDNCTVSDSYIAACQLGRVIVATFDHADKRYTIAWHHDGDTWNVRDLKGAGNAEPPPEVEAIAAQLTEHLDRLEPQRPVAINRTATLTELTIRPLPSTTRSPSTNSIELR